VGGEPLLGIAPKHDVHRHFLPISPSGRQMVNPPSTEMVAPVVQSDSAEAR